MDACPEPHVEMEGDAEYRRQLDLFSSCCTEKQDELVRLGEIRDYLERECKVEGGYRLVQDEVLLAVGRKTA